MTAPKRNIAAPQPKREKVLSLVGWRSLSCLLTNAISPPELPHRPIAVGHLASEAHRIQYERNEEGKQRTHHHQHSDAIELVLQIGIERFQADPGQQGRYGISDERDDAKDCSRFDVDWKDVKKMISIRVGVVNGY